jgi:hypothetical protein
VLTTHLQVEDINASYAGTTVMAIVPLPLSPGAEASEATDSASQSGAVP